MRRGLNQRFVGRDRGDRGSVGWDSDRTDGMEIGEGDATNWDSGDHIMCWRKCMCFLIFGKQ